MLHYQMNEHGFQIKTEYGNLPISAQDVHGYRPYELFVSAIASCSGITFKKILEKMRIHFSDIQITAQPVRNPDYANRIERLHLTYTIFSTNASVEKLEKILPLIDKNCGMIQSVFDSIIITKSIIKKD